ncbi:MAG: hypothetical protein AAF515_01650 [Pseudomonadota bacterium]
METKTLLLEILRETDFLTESVDWQAAKFEATAGQVQQSLKAINKACSAALNGQDPEPHVARFLRRHLEADVYEEMEIWGKFSPPPQFIQDQSEESD